MAGTAVDVQAAVARPRGGEAGGDLQVRASGMGRVGRIGLGLAREEAGGVAIRIGHDRLMVRIFQTHSSAAQTTTNIPQ